MYKIDTVIFFPLFKVAQAHADQCVFAHDCSQCRKVRKLDFILKVLSPTYYSSVWVCLFLNLRLKKIIQIYIFSDFKLNSINLWAIFTK